MGMKERTKIRQILVDELEADIVGPRCETEILKINPKNEYLSGVLFPGGWELDEEDKVRDETETDGDDVSHYVLQDNLFKPSSFGLTCRVVLDAKNISVKISYGRYTALKNKDTGFQQWERTPKSEKFTIKINDEEDEIPFTTNSKFVIRYSTIRKNDHVILSVYVVNKVKITQNTPFMDIIFQPKIILESEDGNHIFVEDALASKELNSTDGLDELFRDKISFGKGHLCAVTWDDINIEGRQASKISTTFTPIQNIERITPDVLPNSLDCMDMVKIAKCSSKSDLGQILNEIVSKYVAWIDETETHLKDGMDNDIIARNIKECRHAADRIHLGIQVLTEDDNAFEAFKFANMAIAWQQTMSKWAKKNAAGNEVVGHAPLEPDSKNRWRLFQIAFILLNIESIANPLSKDRETVDLLWFPTGGGKTEAYLGLVAFVISYRRLRGKNTESIGTSVLMRYTLRLLTIQQFQRAAALMCACEKIRRSNDSKWGKIPFQVGLWVGSKVTPNKRRSAMNAKYNLQGSDLTQIRTDNPYILINCPWCGKKLRPANGEVSGEPVQWRLFCGRNECMFAKHNDTNKDGSLPIVLVDEDVYSRCPSMIISTVDKFAQISWKQECRSIFGRVRKYCKYCGFYNADSAKISHKHSDNNSPSDVRIPPPELIIQDELHLISGALGSMASIYETAIEHLCTREGIKPKVIASTATIRAAPEQIRSLFNRRNTKVFPPQVRKFGNTFFSNTQSEFGEDRMYVGVLGTGKSGVNVLTRVSAVILRRIRQLAGSGAYSKEDLDPYLSLVSYFNSQKELGVAAMGFKDSVPELISRIRVQFEGKQETTISSQSEEISVQEADKVSQDVEPQNGDQSIMTAVIPERVYKRQFGSLEVEELTSRKSSGEIPEILRRLDKTIQDEDVVDALLATNMLSVGVDIPRLSTMIVAGQPKSHSEYIQATGRIGRKSPGLIITVYSYTKPRDLSHYENFKIYHSTFFKNVETVSITPFTTRTRDIALFGVFVGMLRMRCLALAGDSDASSFDPKDRDIQTAIEEVKTILDDRVSEIDPPEHSNTMKDVDKLIKRWVYYRRTHGDRLRYSQIHEDAAKALKESYYMLLKSNPASDHQLIWTPTSLRNTEQEQKLFYMKEAEYEDE